MNLPAGDNHRSAKQINHEKALVLVRKAGGDNYREPALSEAITDLERTHKRLMQDTCHGGESLQPI